MATTGSQRVAKARATLIQAGGRRVGLWLQPDAAAALDALLLAGYAPNASGVISAALLDAQRKVSRRS